MNFTLRSATATLCNDDTVLHERVTRRQSITLDRFLSFNENTSSSTKARRSSTERRRSSSKQPTLPLIELLDDEDDDRDDETHSSALCHECSQCSKVFASEYGLNHHTNMHHPNQSVLCADCNIVFRSHRSLKTHLQRHHHSSSQSLQSNTNSTRLDPSSTTRSYYARTTAASTAASVAHPLPNYAYISSYLVVAFSSQQFPAIAKTACEHGRLPLGEFTSKLFRCQNCHISFPCSRTLRYHLQTNHEQQLLTVCHRLLDELVLSVEQNLQTKMITTNLLAEMIQTIEINHQERIGTVMDEDSGMGSDHPSPLSPHDTNESNSNLPIEVDDLDSFACQLAQQANHFGLIDKQLAMKSRRYNREQKRVIFPLCEHENRTCANLCLTHLSSYSQLLRNYPYTILTLPKGNPFAQGPIVSSVGGSGKQTTNSIPSTMTVVVPPTNDSGPLAESSQKRKFAKRMTTPSSNGSSSPQLKKKICSETHMTTRNARTIVNNNLTTVEQSTKTTMNETKSVNHLEQFDTSSVVTIMTTTSTTTTRKILPKETPNYMRSLSFSSNSSSSTSTLTKSSSSSSNLTQQRTLKRSLSPSITVTLEKPVRKRRRRREQRRKTAPPSVATIKIELDDDDIEQENDDEDDNNDVIPVQIQPRPPKQRQASSGSIEYVQTLNNDLPQQSSSSSSLNNIENIKSTYSTSSKINDDEIIICRSPPTTKKVLSSTKNPSKTSVNGSARKATMQTTSNDEHVRVRCKVCGEILEGRSRFSQHVLRMHSHLLKKNIAQAKQQQQTAIVR